MRGIATILSVWLLLGLGGVVGIPQNAGGNGKRQVTSETSAGAGAGAGKHCCAHLKLDMIELMPRAVSSISSAVDSSVTS